jgi:A/G-specific adenine glycosylase
MLQQTTVGAVKAYYAAFLERWPSISDLSAAPLDEVLSAWAGLGYYARARNLHGCAQAVVEHHGGIFPTTEKALRQLPGIGDYTAAAMAAIIHEAPANVVDGNIERVMARLHKVEETLPRAKADLKALAAHYVAKDRAADWPQALMDLGATVCRPKAPKCDSCPLKACCKAQKTGQPADYPRRAPKGAKPVRYGAAFVLLRENTVLLHRRPPTGLLGGMCEVPGSAWGNRAIEAGEAMTSAPVQANWHVVGKISHVFTHFTLFLDVYLATAPDEFATNAGWWAALDALDREALPSLMHKVLALALAPPK